MLDELYSFQRCLYDRKSSKTQPIHMSLCLSVCMSQSQGILVNKSIDSPILYRSIDSCLTQELIISSQPFFQFINYYEYTNLHYIELKSEFLSNEIRKINKCFDNNQS